jgi:transposase
VSGLSGLSRLAGHCHAAAAHFCVSVSFVVRLIRAFRTTGSLAPKPSGGRRHAKLDPHRAFLVARIEEKADITMPELSAELAVATGTRADPASLSRFLIRNGYRFKKKLSWQPSKIVPTSKRRAKNGPRRASRTCGLSRIG